MSPFYTEGENESAGKKPFAYSFTIETRSDNHPINYRLKSTHFGETCQQRLQEGLNEDPSIPSIQLKVPDCFK
jgi:hypothetical protein